MTMEYFVGSHGLIVTWMHSGGTVLYLLKEIYTLFSCLCYYFVKIQDMCMKVCHKICDGCAQKGPTLDFEIVAFWSIMEERNGYCKMQVGHL